MYISAHISFDRKSAEIDFPISDDMLDDILREAGMPTDTTMPFYVEDIHHPAELSRLGGKDVNLDELNYLAKKLDCMTDDELDQFYAAMEHKDVNGLKNLINLSFNLNKFTIIKDVGNMTNVGREYTLYTEGSTPADSRYDAKYAEIGRKLLSSGRGIFTEYGLLFVEDKPMDYVYDGQVFPSFAYNACIVNVDVEYKGKYESLFLPDSELAIQKAIRRLGAESIDDCECSCGYENPNYGRLSVKFEDILDNEGIYALNSLCKAFDEQEVDLVKLDAAMEMTGVSSSKNMITLINYLDDLELVSSIDVNDYDEVGRYFLEHSDEYKMSDELYDFFNFEDFGGYIAGEYAGQFTSCGFIYYGGVDSMDVILNALEDEDSAMTMGDI